MPDPAKFTSKKNFMEECMHQTRKVEKLPQDQSIAVCLSKWREEKGGKKPPRKKQGTHMLLKILAQRLAEYA
jgi:hypothetical protein